MSRKLSGVLIQHKTGTAAQWTSANPTLAKGEIGFETDSNRLKIGDGVTSWNNLSYLQAVGDVINSYDVSDSNSWWIKYNGSLGIIEQGGLIPTSHRTNVSITFPIAYPNAVLSIVHSSYADNSNSSGRGLDVVRSYSLTGFIFYAGFDMDHAQFWYSKGY